MARMSETAERSRAKTAGFALPRPAPLGCDVTSRRRMPWAVVFLCFIVCFTTSSLAASIDRPLLWSLTSSTNTVWLLGSMHIMPPGAHAPPEATEKAYAESPILVFEADLDALASPAAQATVRRLGFYHEGDSIRNHLSTWTYSALVQRTAATGVPMDQLERMRPWLCGITLSTAALQRLGYSQENGVDRLFFQRARKDGRKRLYLETVDFQLGLFAGLVEKDQDALLRQMLSELETLDTTSRQMTEAWKSGDAEGLHELIRKSFKDFPVLYRRLMLDRNRNWISSIEGLARGKDNALVIVGAGHLLGPDSVIDLLERKGHRIERN